MDSSGKSLSLADLEAYDGQSAGRGVERRFLCPYCGDAKPRNSAHRSMAANMDTGAYNCHRCKVKGKLSEWWTDRPLTSPRTAQSARLRRAFAVEPIASPTSTDSDWRKRLENLIPLDSPEAQVGAKYLAGRGISVEIAALSGAQFCRSWYGDPAIVFPLYDEAGALTAGQGRAIFNDKKLIAGPKSNGVFTAHARAENGDVQHAIDGQQRVMVTEAPIDALSLACCGFPAVALCGTSFPAWFHRKCGLRRVMLATDADEAGDAAAVTLAAMLARYGAKCERLRPIGAKDWNAMLLASGLRTLRDYIEACVLPPPLPVPNTARTAYDARYAIEFALGDERLLPDQRARLLDIAHQLIEANRVKA